MFRRVRDAARRGRRHASNVLAAIGRAAVKVGVWLGHGALKAGVLLGKGCKYLARGITWTWMSAVEVYCLTDAPFTWIIGNVLFGILRVGETVLNWFRDAKSTAMHDIFPSFTLQNANAFNMVAYYPFVALIGWLLSPISGKDWWAETRAQYKYRTINLADWPYADRFTADLWPVIKKVDEQAWAEATDHDAGFEEAIIRTQKTPEDVEEFYTSIGLVRIYPNPNSGITDDFEYLEERIRAAGSDDDFLDARADRFNRWWGNIPTGVDPTPPLVDPHDPRHAKVSEPMEEPPVAPEEEEEHADWLRPDADVPDYNDVEDKKLRSWLYGRSIVLLSIEQMTGFLDNQELQNKQRALVFNDTKNPGSGLLSPHALKGFEEMLAAAKKAAHPV